MSATIDRVEQIRQQGLAKFRANELEKAVELFDQALSLASDDETRELLTVNKAAAFILMEVTSDEVLRLPQIIMRRRNPRHVLLAAYYLGRKFENEKDLKRSGFYYTLSNETAQQLGESGWIAATLTALGNNAVYDSRPEDAVRYYEEALPLLGSSAEENVTRSFAIQNLGYCRLMTGESSEGVRLIHEAVELMRASGAEGYTAESYLDLCLGYLDLDDLEKARHFGELGLQTATEVRQVRNAHYLLGEVALKAADVERAEFHFEHLAKHYPDFANLKNLLYALDLRKMVNFKL